MPLNVRRFCSSVLLVLFSFFIINAQTAPTSGEVMRQRISKAKALIAVKNYNAAIYELENIRRETNDQTVHGVLNVLLMNCYLEQGDYKRAQDFLNDLFNAAKVNKPGATAIYYAAAGQIVKGARNQAERYKSLGLTVSDRNLPPEAAGDLEKMREMLEKVVEQSKTLGKDTKQTSNAMALLEEASNARSGLARDDYDAQRWRNEVADSRETLANSRSVVLNATGETTTEPQQNTAASNTVQPNTVAANTNPNNPSNIPVNTASTKTNETVPTYQPVSSSNEVKSKTDLTAKEEKTANQTPTETPKTEEKKTEQTAKIEEKPKVETDKTENSSTVPTTKRERRIVKTPEENTENKNETVAAASNDDSPLQVGSLLEYALQKPNPIYPQTARSMRQTGVVRVELIIDENGEVTAVQNVTGPALLQVAAKDAVKKWRFKPFLREGQPVKATGFVSFNFNL